MKLIKPSEISAKILTLLDESDERVVLVSPYMRILKWYKLLNRLNGLKSRGIHLEIYVRDDHENMGTFDDLDQLELVYKRIPNLHSKLYLNERCGIVTSMNLLLSSEINSLEIGYVTETQEEYYELLHFYHRYIQNRTTTHHERMSGFHAAKLKKLEQSIWEELESMAKKPWIWLDKNALHINTGRNNYCVSITRGSLSITARLLNTSAIKQNSAQHSASISKKVRDLTHMNVDILPDALPDIIHLTAQAHHKLKSTSISGLLEADLSNILESVIQFVSVADDLVIQNHCQHPKTTPAP